MRQVLLAGLISGIVASGSVLGAQTGSLADAMKARDVARVDALLGQRVDVNARQPDGTTALHWAAYWDDAALVERLIRAGARVDVANRFKETPLSVAAGNANARVLDLLLNAGASANGTSGEGEPILMTVSRKGNLEAVKTLLARGANVNATEAWLGQTALMWAADEGHTAVVKTLLESGAAVDAVSKGGFTALHFAVRSAATEAGRLLITAGADVNRKVTNGSSPTPPLMLALMNASYDLAVTLIEWGADASDASPGFGVLHQLVWTAVPHNPGIYPPPPQLHGRRSSLTALDMVKVLADAGANPNEPQVDLSPFSYKMGQLGAIEGITPLMLAARMQDVPLMKALLAAGADGTRMTWNSTTLLMVAAGLTSWEGEMPAFRPGSYLETLALALDVCGCDVNHQNDNGWTALHAAVYNRSNDGIRWLASKGARFDIKTYFDDLSFPWRGPGKTPLRLAEGQYQAMVYRYFCEQQPVLRELMGLPPSECVRTLEGEAEAASGGGR